jgi:hypothetical protein
MTSDAVASLEVRRREDLDARRRLELARCTRPRADHDRSIRTTRSSATDESVGQVQRGQECHLDAVINEAVALSASGLLIGASAPFAIPGRYGFSVDYVCRR